MSLLQEIMKALDKAGEEVKEEVEKVFHHREKLSTTHVDIVVAAKVVTPVEPETTPTDQILTTNPTK